MEGWLGQEGVQYRYHCGVGSGKTRMRQQRVIGLVRVLVIGLVRTLVIGLVRDLDYDLVNDLVRDMSRV